MGYACLVSDLAKKHGITPFDLFCAYHLGITAEDGYRFQNLHDVAKRFGCSSGVIKQVLADLGMDPDALVHSSWDMASAQVDIMAAPEGVSRRELAKQLFEDFTNAPRKRRDWATEIARDARENEKTYGKRPPTGSGGGRR